MALEKIQNNQLGRHHRNKGEGLYFRGCFFLNFGNIQGERFAQKPLKVEKNFEKGENERLFASNPAPPQSFKTLRRSWI